MIKIRLIVSQKDAEKLVHTFVPGCWNLLLSGSPNNSLRSLRLIHSTGKRNHHLICFSHFTGSLFHALLFSLLFSSFLTVTDNMSGTFVLARFSFP